MYLDKADLFMMNKLGGGGGGEGYHLCWVSYYQLVLEPVLILVMLVLIILVHMDRKLIKVISIIFEGVGILMSNFLLVVGYFILLRLLRAITISNLLEIFFLRD